MIAPSETMEQRLGRDRHRLAPSPQPPFRVSFILFPETGGWDACRTA